MGGRRPNPAGLFLLLPLLSDTDTPPSSLTDTELERYSRHLLLDGFSEDDQQRLRRSSVLVVGLGGLGGPAALYLASSGVGRLVIADGDRVDLGNLQRQIVHGETAIGRPKAASARGRLREINHGVIVEALDARLAGDELERRVAAVDLVVDASDDFSTRYEINRLCRRYGRRHVYGACIGWRGHVAVFSHRTATPCLECLFSESDEAEDGGCAARGVFAPLTGVVGSLMAAEALKSLCSSDTVAAGRLCRLDLRGLDVARWVAIPRHAGCGVCGGIKADAGDADRGYNRRSGGGDV